MELIKLNISEEELDKIFAPIMNSSSTPRKKEETKPKRIPCDFCSEACGNSWCPMNDKRS